LYDCIPAFQRGIYIQGSHYHLRVTGRDFVAQKNVRAFKKVLPEIEAFMFTVSSLAYRSV